MLAFLEKLENWQNNNVEPLKGCLYTNNASILIMPIHLRQNFNQIIKIQAILQNYHTFINSAQNGNYQIKH